MLKVILIDDEERILSGLRKIVDWKAAGFEVVGTFSDSEEAVKIAPGLRPNLIITDIEMPGLSGLELIVQLKEVLPETQFAVLSAHDQFSYAQQALRYGVFRYILKPIDPKELMAFLKEVRERFQVAAQAGDTGERAREERERYLQLRKFMIVRESVSENYIRQPGEKDLIYETMKDTFVFYVVFLHLRSPAGAKGKYYPYNQKLLERLRAYCDAKLYYTTFFQKDNSLVFVFERGEQPPCFEELLKTAREIFDMPAIIGITRDEVGLEQAYDFFQSAYAQFQTALFYEKEDCILKLRPVQGQGEEKIAQMLESARKKFPDLIRTLDRRGLEEYHTEIETELSALRDVVSYEQALLFYGEIVRIFAVACRDVTAEESGKEYYARTFPRFYYLSDCKEYAQKAMLEHLNEVAPSVGDGTSAIVNQVKLYIHENYGQSDLKLSRVAEERHVNYSYLSYLFKKKTGTNFLAYLTEVRVNEARKLLLNTELSIFEVATRVGFQDSQSFYYVFRKACGYSPNEFRRMNASEKAGETV